MVHHSNKTFKARGPVRLTRQCFSLIAATLAFLLCQTAIADGTETLGPPSIAIASGSDVIVAGVGLIQGQPDDIEFTVPDGATVQQVLLYWEGREFNGSGDNTITVDNLDVTGTLIGGPIVWTVGGTSTVYRADITGLGLVTPGANTLTIDGLGFSNISNGAGVTVIIEEDGSSADIQWRDGNDLAFFDWVSPQDTTVAQTFTFPASTEDRVATISLHFSAVAGEASGGGFRPSVIEVTVGSTVTEFVDALNSNDGQEWDSLQFDVDVPAGETAITVQALSEDRGTTDGNPASFVWLGGGVSIPEIPRNPDIELLKQVSVDGGTEYFDADDPGSAPTAAIGGGALYRLIVRNTGDVELTNVVINDPTLGISNVGIADLPVGAEVIIDSGQIPALDAPDVCEEPGTVTNVAFVSGDPVTGGDPVDDSDPANVVCPDEPVACWFTGGQNIKVNRVRGQPEHSGGGNIYPSCSALPGQGGQWTHTDHVQGLHFQAQSLTVLECGNVEEIPPGAPSPAVTVNFIRATATGIIKGVGGNTLAESPATAVVIMEDWGEPGRNDKYTILATGGGETISLDRAALENGGNFQIHQTSCN